ncbi:MAG: HNH endonuclease [Anaerolineae bacterium]|nr:HNH endonuclease [Anaerolineae bacterium]
MSRIHIPESLRRLVTERANGRCEYCLLHQDDTPFTHPIDHVVALKHGGLTIAENLALACLECNLNKGTDLATFDPLTGELDRLYHPRQQSWEEHFALEGVRIVGLTMYGRATVRLLQFNTPARLAERELLRDNSRYPG